MGNLMDNSSADRIFSSASVSDFVSNLSLFSFEEFCPDFAQAIADFDLSILNSSYDSIEVPIGQNSEARRESVLPIFTETDSLVFRISQIEEQLGVFNLVFWGVQADRASEFLSTLCKNLFSWDWYGCLL